MAVELKQTDMQADSRQTDRQAETDRQAVTEQR